MGRSRYKQYETCYPYLITSSIVHGLPLFAKPELASYLIDTIKYHQSGSDLKVQAWCIMENHFHMIAVHKNLGKCMQSLKSYTAKCIVEYLKLKNNKLYLKQLAFSRKQGRMNLLIRFGKRGFIRSRYFRMKCYIKR